MTRFLLLTVFGYLSSHEIQHKVACLNKAFRNGVNSMSGLLSDNAPRTYTVLLNLTQSKEQLQKSQDRFMVALMSNNFHLVQVCFVNSTHLVLKEFPSEF